MTVFGPAWTDLTLAHLQAFLDEAPSEPLLWECKRELQAKSLRKAVCGFANGHDTGYLIIGAHEHGGAWALDGAAFPTGDPPTDITNLLIHDAVMPYPDGLDVQSFPVGSEGTHIAVVQIPPSQTPPCITAGTVYERVSGQTLPVKDPARLAALFARGDGARQAGVEKAEQIAARVGKLAGGEQQNVRFALGLGAPGYPLDLTPRLFVPSFSTSAQERIAAVMSGWPPGGLGEPRIFPTVTQHELVFRVESVDRDRYEDWMICVARHGVVGVHWTKGVQRSSVTSLVQPPDSPVEQAWRYAHETLTDLGVKSPRYLHLTVGVPLPAPAFVARGGVFGPTEAGLASIERELRRAGGEMILEDEPEP